MVFSEWVILRSNKIANRSVQMKYALLIGETKVTKTVVCTNLVDDAIHSVLLEGIISIVMQRGRFNQSY